MYTKKKERKKKDRLNLILFQFETKCKLIKYELYVVNSQFLTLKQNLTSIFSNKLTCPSKKPIQLRKVLATHP